MTYLTNLKAWVRGFGRFSEISFKPGWSVDQRRYPSASDYLR
jgi:hypothetical protein